MRYAGIDYGTKRVGVAFSDEKGRMAFPDCVLRNDKDFFSELKARLADKGAKAIVIGESRDLGGEPNPVAADIDRFAEKLKREINLPIYFEPEFYTSVEAGRIQGKNEMHDASAAAIILQSYLDRHRDD